VHTSPLSTVPGALIAGIVGKNGFRAGRMASTSPARLSVSRRIRVAPCLLLPSRLDVLHEWHNLRSESSFNVAAGSKQVWTNPGTKGHNVGVKKAGATSRVETHVFGATGNLQQFLAEVIGTKLGSRPRLKARSQAMRLGVLGAIGDVMWQLAAVQRSSPAWLQLKYRLDPVRLDSNRALLWNRAA